MLWLYAMKCNLWEGLIGSETELMNLKYNFFTEKKSLPFSQNYS